MQPSWPTALGLAGGLGLDAVLGDPRRGHPVALFGSFAGATERLVHKDSRAVGLLYAAVSACSVSVSRGRHGGQLAWRL
jgi:adenosylcobinamide-phosphate synthase